MATQTCKYMRFPYIFLYPGGGFHPLGVRTFKQVNLTSIHFQEG